jgi:curved DNA-binding protein CbpA
MKTYYNILNVSPRASDEEVRRAWHVLALRWHPDRNPANRIRAQRMFIEVNRAYAVLKTQPQREAYNRFLLKRPHPPTLRVGPTLSLKGEGARAERGRVRAFFDCLAEILWPFVVKGAA